MQIESFDEKSLPTIDHHLLVYVVPFPLLSESDKSRGDLLPFDFILQN